MKWHPKSERIRFGKDVRIAVHAKCHGHCAYCGCKVTMQEMQIDHIVALHNGGDNRESKIEGQAVQVYNV